MIRDSEISQPLVIITAKDLVEHPNHVSRYNAAVEATATAVIAAIKKNIGKEVKTKIDKSG